MTSTRTGLQAWILTVSTEAGQFTWTVCVHGTLGLILLHDNFTFDVGVTAVSRRATARRHVVVDPTLGVGTTIARVLALLVTAGQPIRAVVVDSAFGSVAADQSVAPISVQAVASRPMIVVGLAHRIGATLSVQARIDAFTVNARQLCWTVGVGAAAHLVACGLRVSSKATLAHTQRAMQLHVAFRVLATDVSLGTRVHASLVQARLVVGALAIRLTFGSGSHLDWSVIYTTDAFRVRRSKVVGRARAQGFVVDGIADGTHTAGVNAWITATLIVAGTIASTVRINDALGIAAKRSAVVYTANSIPFARGRIARIDGVALLRLALGKWIAYEFVHTGTNRAVIHYQTLRVVAAHAGTGIDALLVDACQIPGTIRINGTLWSTPAGEGRAVISGQTLTQGAGSVTSTNRIDAARGRVTWVRVVLMVYAMYRGAVPEGIARQIVGTCTNRNVIHD